MLKSPLIAQVLLTAMRTESSYLQSYVSNVGDCIAGPRLRNLLLTFQEAISSESISISGSMNIVIHILKILCDDVDDFKRVEEGRLRHTCSVIQLKFRVMRLT